MFVVHERGDISDTVNFPKLSQVREPDINLSDEYMQIVQNILRQFESRFEGVETFCTAFQLFANAFSVDFKYVPSRYQLELLNLQSDDLLCYKYNIFSEAKCRKLYSFAAQVLCMSGSMHVCEQLFPVMDLLSFPQEVSCQITT